MDWFPIETAPKTERILLYRPNHDEIVAGEWDDDRYSRNPRPYWHTDRTRLWGMLDTRKFPPTHWAPISKPVNGA